MTMGQQKISATVYSAPEWDASFPEKQASSTRIATEACDCRHIRGPVPISALSYRSFPATQIRTKNALPMSLGELFASIKERRRSAEQSCEEGAQIIKRLQGLLDVRTTTPMIEAP